MTADEPVRTEQSIDPRTGRVTTALPTSTEQETRAALAASAVAVPELAGVSPQVRARWLAAVADALEVPATASRLVSLADEETALGVERLTGELARTAAQLRFYADVASEGSYLRATLDHLPGGSTLARVNQPVGPVAVFGASNFPFAFGVLGNDTASALAAGCPVVVKGHPAHPRLSRELADVAVAALAGAGAPAGAFALVTGFDSGRRLVQADEVRAVAFTGSQAGGMSLRAAALARRAPVPVFAEMGTVNPVVVTPAGSASVEEVAKGFVGSFTLGAGQYCTKPGLLLAPAGHGAPDAVAAALTAAAPQGWALTSAIAKAAAAGVEAMVGEGARVLASVPGPGTGFSVDSVLLAASPGALQPGSRLLEECFGPVALVVEYDGPQQLRSIVSSLPGTLVAGVMAGAGDDPDAAAVVELLVPLAGRVTAGDWPTGVAWTWAQQHGGPWPSTSEPAATSVGAAALDRFTRPVAYQRVPDAVLPPALREANPWHLPRRVDGTWAGP